MPVLRGRRGMAMSSVFWAGKVGLTLPRDSAALAVEVNPESITRLLERAARRMEPSVWPFLLASFVGDLGKPPLLSVLAPESRPDGAEIVREVKGERVMSVLERPRSGVLEVGFTLFALVVVGPEGGDRLRVSAQATRMGRESFSVLRMGLVPASGVGEGEVKAMFQALFFPSVGEFEAEVEAEVFHVPERAGLLVAVDERRPVVVVGFAGEARLLEELLRE